MPTGGLAELTVPGLGLPGDGASEGSVPADLAYRPALAADGGAVKHTVVMCADNTFVSCEGDTVVAEDQAGHVTQSDMRSFTTK